MPGSIANAVMAVLKATIIVVVVGWILNLPSRLGIGLFTEQMLAVVLGCSLALTFLMFPPRRRAADGEAEGGALTDAQRHEKGIGWIDWVCAAVALSACLYVALRYPELIKELVHRPWYGVLVAAVIVLAVFEASRRVAGIWLVAIVLVLCAHALLGWMLPEMFASRPVTVSRLLVYLAIDTNALLGSTLQTAVIVVIPFIIMGSILMRCGGGDFFADLASALMGRYRGGSAKIAVVGSAFFGMVSGSAVANVASVGTITIPLMKRSGFPGHLAGGIEAVGSTGGQVAPPVMGAAAFLMAEYLQVPYSHVLVAAIIPASLYYASLFIQVDLESAKRGITGLPADALPAAARVLGEGWHFLLPFAVLIGGLLWWNLEAEYAAFLATAVLVVLALLVPYKGRRALPGAVLGAVIAAGGAVVDIVAITAIAGVLIGAMAITGVAFSLTHQLLTLSGGSLILLLVLTAIASFILGLPLPTVGVYIILATLAAPALVQAGISPMQAHMFVLFNGMLGMVTPPVALAAFAAATIAQADPWKTGWTAMRLSWCAYVIPFLFAYSPTLIMQGSTLEVLSALGLALVGIFMGTIAVVGYLWAPISGGLRLAHALVAVMTLLPAGAFPSAGWVNALGVSAAAATLAGEIVRARRQGHGPLAARTLRGAMEDR
jgi:TRAP transporter 4TM/12TM fusion protein